MVRSFASVALIVMAIGVPAIIYYLQINNQHGDNFLSRSDSLIENSQQKLSVLASFYILSKSKSNTQLRLKHIRNHEEDSNPEILS